jgi:hypothetical protein
MLTLFVVPTAYTLLAGHRTKEPLDKPAIAPTPHPAGD